MRFFCSAIADNRYARESFCSGSNLERYRTGGFGQERSASISCRRSALNLYLPVGGIAKFLMHLSDERPVSDVQFCRGSINKKWPPAVTPDGRNR